MQVRRAVEGDLPHILALARSLDLDYPEMERDALWVAEESGRIIGLVALKRHPDCLELCALGVDPKHRGRGAAKALVDELCAAANGDVHLGTVIPGFFETCGFTEAPAVPQAFVEKRKTLWCEGCDKASCRVMVRRKP